MSCEGREQPIKMLKTQVDPEMSMKTKDKLTICPREKTTFVPGWRLFCRKIHESCSDDRLFSNFERYGASHSLENVEI